MAIYVVDGKPRHGKTAWVVSHIPYWLKDARDFGLKVFSNVKLNLGKGKFKKFLPSCVGDLHNPKDLKSKNKLVFYWRNVQDWNLMTHGRIFADEGTRYFNARSWGQLHPDTEIKLQQHGKEDLDIWLTVQHYTRLDVTLRVLVEEFYRVERVFGWGNNTIVSRVTAHQLEQIDQYERDVNAAKMNPDLKVKLDYYDKEYFWIRKKYKRMYDTRQAVAASEPMPLRHEARYCLDPNCKFHKEPHISHA